MIELKNVVRDYSHGLRMLRVVDSVNLQIKEGQFVAITGHSGSGKSTLLGLMAGLDKPNQGSVLIDGKDITGLSENSLSELRRNKIGFIFQSFHLIPTLTALENVRVPAELQETAESSSIDDRAMELLRLVGLADRYDHYPSELSGGEMQRVAIARAYITSPPILFADEPTGNLDSENGRMVIELLLELNKNSTLVLVTHNPELAALADREIRLQDGKIIEEINRKSQSRSRSTVNKKKRSSKKALLKKGAAKKA